MRRGSTITRAPVPWNGPDAEKLARAASALERDLLRVRAYARERGPADERAVTDALAMIEEATREGIAHARDPNEAAETLDASAFHLRTLLAEIRRTGGAIS